MEDPSVRSERIIAGARLVLSITAIELVLLSPGQLVQEGNATYTVVALYFLYSMAVMWLVDRNLMQVRRVAFYSQAVDTLWFPVILLYTQGENSPFFLFYVFSLITASFRWGFKETLYVNTANVGMYMIVHIATVRADFTFYQSWVRPTYLYVLACLIGYLGEHQKKASTQLLILAELSRSIRIKDRFSRMLEELMERVRNLFQVDQCIVIFHDEEADRFFLKKVKAEKKGNSSRLVELHPDEIDFLISPRQNFGYLVNPKKRMAGIFGLSDVLVYDFDSQKTISQAFQPNRQLISIFEMESVLSVPIILNEQFKGRVYLANKVHGYFSYSDLQYLKLIVSQVGPLIENYRLLKRMHTLSVLEEKNRIARDLHDGLVQSLASLDLRIEVCKKLCQDSPPNVKRDIAELQRIVRAEHGELRNYMKRLRSSSFGSNELAEAIRGYVQNFEKENRLVVKLSIEPEHLDLPRKVSNEIYHIIQEGLTNVKKHAAARQVLIQLSRDAAAANLVISDDGRGFPFGAKTTSYPIRREPWSIYERARALNGSLTVESGPGKGSTLFIRIPIALNEKAEAGLRLQER